jgi:hypothetical protein
MKRSLAIATWEPDQMNKTKIHNRVDQSGSTFDSFLEEEGIREEVEVVVIERVQAWQRAVEPRSNGQPRAAVPTKAREH